MRGVPVLAVEGLRLRFRLTDLEYRPIAGEPLKLRVGAVMSEEMETDVEGRAEMVAPRERVERKWVKRPGNFVSSLISLPQTVDAVVAGAELAYAGHRWLYTAEVLRFRNGDAMLGEAAVYTPAKARRRGLDWYMVDLGGLLLTGPGHEVWEFNLQPEREGWVIDLGMKRFPAPVRPDMAGWEG